MKIKQLQDQLKDAVEAIEGNTDYRVTSWRLSNRSGYGTTLYIEADWVGTLKAMTILFPKDAHCECGAEKSGSAIHSDWCPKKNELERQRTVPQTM